jgi:hypothetical protein
VDLGGQPDIRVALLLEHADAAQLAEQAVTADDDEREHQQVQEGIEQRHRPRDRRAAGTRHVLDDADHDRGGDPGPQPEDVHHGDHRQEVQDGQVRHDAGDAVDVADRDDGRGDGDRYGDLRLLGHEGHRDVLLRLSTSGPRR